jgi:hypothetical protein
MLEDCLDGGPVNLYTIVNGVTKSKRLDHFPYHNRMLEDFGDRRPVNLHTGVNGLTQIDTT